MSVTIRDIAVLAGCSPATVSRYLTGKKIVSDELAERIECAIKETGYQHTRRVGRKSGMVVVVLITNLKIQFYHDVLQEIIRQAGMLNMRVIFAPIDSRKDYFKELFNTVNIDGCIYLDEDLSPRIIRYFTSKKIRTVMCGGKAQEHDVDSVHINDLEAAYEGTKYLLNLGHRDILFLCDYPRSVSAGFLRLAGCKRALEEQNIIYRERFIRYGKLSYEAGCDLTEQVMKEGLKPTAIFAFSDEMARGAIHALEKLKLMVPEDISVMGFDDLPSNLRYSPSLTTIHQPLTAFVSIALELVCSSNQKESVDMTLPFQLVERDTCKKINNQIHIVERGK